MVNEISPLFESAVVTVEIFTVYIYLSGILLRNDRSRLQGILAYLAFGLLLGTASIFYPDMILLPTITFAGVGCLAWFLYKAHVLSAVFSSFLYLILAVAIEAIVPALHSLIFGIELESIHSFGVDRILSTITIKLLILLVVKIVSVILGKHKDSLHRRMLQSIPLIVCQLILISVIASDFINSYIEYGALTTRTLFEILGLFFIDIIVLWYYDLLVSIYELRHRNEIATMQLENQVKHYEIIKSHQETISAIEHDMKKHVKAIENMAKAGHSEEVSNYIERFTETISENMGLVFTPHPMISSILSYCRQRANRASVDLQLDISVPSVIDINQIDLTVILGNTIDNALEALERMTSGERRLRISLKQGDYYLFYEISNTYEASAKKQYWNKALHGYGLKNVHACVEKYIGSCQVKSTPDEYVVTIMLPCQVKNLEK